VRAYNDAGQSDPSNEVFVVVPTFTVTVETVTGVGVVAQTLAGVVLAAAAKVAVAGVVESTLGDATPTVTATVGVTGTVAQTLESATGAVTGTVAVAADVTQTLGATTGAVTGTVTLPSAEADVTQTLDDVACVATGSVHAWPSTLAWVDAVLADAVQAVEGTVLVTATVAQTLEAVGVASSGHAGLVPHDDNIFLARRRG